MEDYLNILHYVIYKAHYKLHIFFNKLNPFMLLHKLPFVKRRCEKLGIDLKQELNKAFSNKQNGLSVMFSGGLVVGIGFLQIMTIASVLLWIAKVDLIFL